MMTRIGTKWLAAWLLILGSSWGLAGEELSHPGDIGRLQGKWEACVGPARDIRVTLDVSGKRVGVVIQTAQGLKIQAKGEIRIDESTSPRNVDWVGFAAGDFQSFPDVQGVYKIENDAFVMCNGGFNGARPADFTPGDGPLADVVTFRRPEPPKVADAGKP
ncbi:hypothetical protein [Paludisphaera mucosa]|uniref:TIGR03067 domain-containing protein n=1 Tax=Paludisphaera mucosa TaxID=3030827 RepID=A0ABT6F5Z5_9BACT|nr:hypothetical protein [Paludisphaera mucosa]MDG3002939.1 hypothetical protein [Paludisphaera mucosa]